MSKALVVSLMLVVLLVACGSDKASQPTDGLDDVDAGLAMAAAVNELLALETVSFTLEHLKGTSELVTGLLMTKAFGEVEIPDRFQVTVEAESKFPKSYVQISTITIEDKAYMTSIISGEWIEVSADSLPFNLSNLGQTLADVVTTVQQPRVLGKERLNGLDTVHIQGQMISENLSELVLGAGDGFTVVVDFWLDETGLLRQVHINGRVIPSDDVDTIRQLTLDDINQPVSINPPK